MEKIYSIDTYNAFLKKDKTPATTKPSIPAEQKEDKKSSGTKYLIGATALAAIAIAGFIISKRAKAAQEAAEKAAREAMEKAAREAAEKAAREQIYTQKIEHLKNLFDENHPDCLRLHNFTEPKFDKAKRIFHFNEGSAKYRENGTLEELNIKGEKIIRISFNENEKPISRATMRNNGTIYQLVEFDEAGIDKKATIFHLDEKIKYEKLEGEKEVYYNPYGTNPNCKITISKDANGDTKYQLTGEPKISHSADGKILYKQDDLKRIVYNYDEEGKLVSIEEITPSLADGILYTTTKYKEKTN